MKKFRHLLLILPLSLLFMAACAKPPSPLQATANITPITEPPKEKVFVFAGDLYNEFSSNQLATEAKYAEKRLVIMGRIAWVRKDFHGNPQVLLVTNISRNAYVLIQNGAYVTFEAEDGGLLAKMGPGDIMGVESTLEGLQSAVMAKAVPHGLLSTGQIERTENSANWNLHSIRGDNSSGSMIFNGR